MRESARAILGEGEHLSLQLGAGVLLENFDPAACGDAAAMRTGILRAMGDPTRRLGATREGTCFRVQPRLAEHRQAGARCDALGDRGLAGVEVSLSGTLVEVTARNLFRLACFGRAVRVAGGVRVDMPLSAPPASLRNLCWAGDLSDGGLLVIQLPRALNTGGITLGSRDGEVGTMPFCFTGQAEPCAAAETAPFAIWLMEPAAEEQPEGEQPEGEQS